MIYACLSVISKTSLVSLAIFSQASETVYVSIFLYGDLQTHAWVSSPIGLWGSFFV